VVLLSVDKTIVYEFSSLYKDEILR
jgi:hypothetical protein